MGRPKLLLPWGRTTILGHLLEQWQRLGAAQIAVVCAAEDRTLEQELVRLKFPSANRILNPTPERGMFSSIQCAAQWNGWNEHISHWAIVLGDQPHLPLETIRAILEFSAANPEKICQPRYAGHRRHPVFLPEPLFKEVADSAVSDLRQFLDVHLSDTLFLESSDPALALDLDTPEDYQSALRTYGGPQ